MLVLSGEVCHVAAEYAMQKALELMYHVATEDAAAKRDAASDALEETKQKALATSTERESHRKSTAKKKSN